MPLSALVPWCLGRLSLQRPRGTIGTWGRSGNSFLSSSLDPTLGIV